jgi:uncharacterized protein (DUF924 family)
VCSDAVAGRRLDPRADRYLWAKVEPLIGALAASERVRNPDKREKRMSTADGIVEFWREAGRELWFAQDAEFDREIARRFGETPHRAARRELDGWSAHASGSLALVLLVDQFPRNMYRRSAHAYATDPLGLLFAERAIARAHDQAMPRELRAFFYLPFEHSEDAANQARAVELFEALDNPGMLDWARRHHDAIRRFGRFPGRNAALGRTTTADEQAWLDQGGGGFSGVEA